MEDKNLITNLKNEIYDFKKKNEEQQKILNKFIDYINANPKILQNPFFLDMRMEIFELDLGNK